MRMQYVCLFVPNGELLFHENKYLTPIHMKNMSMDALNYNDINQVVTSWELARQKYGSEEELGIAILSRLFDLEPDTKKIFKLGEDSKLNGMHRMAVLIHGHRMVQMMDGVLNLLGPDMDTVEEILGQLGERHRRYGVTASYIPLLGHAIRESIAATIGKEWTQAMDTAWAHVYGAISAILIESLK